jgi:antitoxin ParD1/3/4
MESLQIELPETLKHFIEEEVKAGGFGSASDYVQKLLLEAQDRKAAIQTVDSLLRDGLASGEPACADEAYWQRKERQLMEP